MENSYLKVHPFGTRYPKWMSSLPPSDCVQDSNPCVSGSLGHCSKVAPNICLIVNWWIVVASDFITRVSYFIVKYWTSYNGETDLYSNNHDSYWDYIPHTETSTTSTQPLRSVECRERSCVQVSQAVEPIQHWLWLMNRYIDGWIGR